VSPQEYDAWYCTPRGAWIGEAEHRLLRALLRPVPGASVLDVGCGTGYFSRHFARDGCPVTGVDRDATSIAYARTRAGPGERYLVADALSLPFDDASFDYCVSVTALCFVADEPRALAEMTRVARRGLGLGLLNRRSLLHWRKGRQGGSGAYQGARWHTTSEVRELLASLRLEDTRVESGVFLPSGSRRARWLEPMLPAWLPWGSFLAASARVARDEPRRGESPSSGHAPRASH
jgi:SAM-dependent methyltransferase